MYANLGQYEEAKILNEVSPCALYVGHQYLQVIRFQVEIIHGEIVTGCMWSCWHRSALQLCD